MPLSEEELRLLEQMERALVEEDPKLASTLRGTTQWVAYLVNGEGPLWPTGWALVKAASPHTGSAAVVGSPGRRAPASRR